MMSSQELATNNNQVPEGYKKTEVGVIPQDWEVDKFINITEVITCGVAATPKYVTETTGKPFLSAQNVQNGRVIYDNYKFISKELFAQITKHNKPTKGDILYTRVGAGIGEAGVIEDNFEFAIYVSLTLIKPKYQKLDSYWIAYLLNSERYKFLARNGLFAGAGVQNLNVEVVRNFAIPLPPLPEQKAIASVLSDVDVLIAALDKLIAKKRHIKTATMQQLLTGKTRLPGFGEGKGYKKSAIGFIPEDWEVFKFTDVTTLITCGIAATPEYVSETQGYPFLSSTNVKNGQIIWKNFKYITKELHQQLYRNNPPQKGAILYSRVGTIGEAAVIEVDFDFSIYVSLTLIKTNSRLHNYFLVHLLNSFFYKKRANDEVYLGGGVGNLNVNVVRNYPIIVPPLPEQKAIAQVLSDIDSEITALEKRRAKTQAIKQGMMQELLTGRTRIIDN
jgi:type I restriction enzyme S subunit